MAVFVLFIAFPQCLVLGMEEANNKHPLNERINERKHDNILHLGNLANTFPGDVKNLLEKICRMESLTQQAPGMGDQPTFSCCIKGSALL